MERCKRSYHVLCAYAADCQLANWLVSCPEHADAEHTAAVRERKRRERERQRRGRRGKRRKTKHAPPTPNTLAAQRARAAAALGGDASRHAEVVNLALADEDAEAREIAAGAEAVEGAAALREEREFFVKQQKRRERDMARIQPLRISPEAACEGGFKTFGGMASHVRALREVVLLPLLYPDAFANLGVTPPRGVLLHGEPGCGKTHAARALAAECALASGVEVAFYARKGADCLGKFHGDAERELRLLFEHAEAHQPAVLFFDEFDGLAPARGGRGDAVHSSVVSTLLALMDGLKDRGRVVVLAATNCPDALDAALRRPGRFDRELLFTLPGRADRGEILRVHTRRWPDAARPSDGMLSTLARATEGFSAAELAALASSAVVGAATRALGPVSDADIAGGGGDKAKREEGEGGALAAGGDGAVQNCADEAVAVETEAVEAEAGAGGETADAGAADSGAQPAAQADGAPVVHADEEAAAAQLPAAPSPAGAPPAEKHAPDGELAAPAPRDAPPDGETPPDEDLAAPIAPGGGGAAAADDAAVPFAPTAPAAPDDGDGVPSPSSAPTTPPPPSAELPQVVWGKASGFPWWPATLLPLDGPRLPVGALARRAPGRALVQFFDRDATYSWLAPTTQLRPWAPGGAEHERMAVGAYKSSLLTEALERAANAAERCAARAKRVAERADAEARAREQEQRRAAEADARSATAAKVVVTARDWAAALAAAPPPCARRAATAGAPPARRLPRYLAPALAAPTAALLRGVFEWRADLRPPSLADGGDDVALLDALDAVDPPLAAQLVGDDAGAARAEEPREEDSAARVFDYSASSAVAAAALLATGGPLARADGAFRALLCGEGDAGQRAVASAALAALRGRGVPCVAADAAARATGGAAGGLVSAACEARRLAGASGLAVLFLPEVDAWAIAKAAVDASGEQMDVDGADFDPLAAPASQEWQLLEQQVAGARVALVATAASSRVGLPRALAAAFERPAGGGQGGRAVLELPPLAPTRAAACAAAAAADVGAALAAVDKAQHSSEPTASKTSAALAQVGAAELATVGALDDGIRAALHSTMAPLRGKLGVRAA